MGGCRYPVPKLLLQGGGPRRGVCGAPEVLSGTPGQKKDKTGYAEGIRRGSAEHCSQTLGTQRSPQTYVFPKPFAEGDCGVYTVEGK